MEINDVGGRKFIVFILVIGFITMVYLTHYCSGKLDHELTMTLLHQMKWTFVAYLIANQPEKIIALLVGKLDCILDKFISIRKPKEAKHDGDIKTTRND